VSDQPQTLPNGDDSHVHAAMERLRKRVDDHEGRLENLEYIVKELDDALVVHAHLEKRKGERILEHAEFIAKHDEFIEFHELKMREFDEKLNALIDIVMRREGGPEASH
jgi:hypothetical protein